MLNYLNKNDEILKSIIDFNLSYKYEFKNSLGFQLARSIVKHADPLQFIEWRDNARVSGIMNNNDNEKTVIDTTKIVQRFAMVESEKATQRITVYQDKEFNGMILKNLRVLDYSIVCAPSEFDGYFSLLFNLENEAIIMKYYFDFIDFFPVTRMEFEKIFFFFLLHLLKGDNTFNYESIVLAKQEINDIVKFRYIDVNQEFILALLNLMRIDSDLSKSSEEVYEVLRTLNFLVVEQARMIGS